MTPAQVTTGGEFPSREQIAGLGELVFLFMRAPAYQHIPIWRLRQLIEPVADTGHFLIMRQNGVPRATLTWAHMSEEAETRFLSGQPLATRDWMSGDRLWIMDMIAPYKQGSAVRMHRFWEAGLGPEVAKYRFLRGARPGEETRRYTARRLASGKFRALRDFISVDPIEIIQGVKQ